MLKIFSFSTISGFGIIPNLSISFWQLSRNYFSLVKHPSNKLKFNSKKYFRFENKTSGFEKVNCTSLSIFKGSLTKSLYLNKYFHYTYSCRCCCLIDTLDMHSVWDFKCSFVILLVSSPMFHYFSSKTLRHGFTGITVDTLCVVISDPNIVCSVNRLATFKNSNIRSHTVFINFSSVANTRVSFMIVKNLIFKLTPTLPKFKNIIDVRPGHKLKFFRSSFDHKSELFL